MKIEQMYTGSLSQGAYYIESNGEVAVIDPLREIQPYLEKTKNDNATIKYIFETHFHTDFVSGHITLAKATNANIVFGPTASPLFDAIIARDEQSFEIGNCTIVALHTPGHTMESTVYLLRDEEDNDVAVFTGDTLLLGDVGRPDLAQKATVVQEELAAMLFDSLRTKIMPLSDDILIYPAHGPDYVCAKRIMKEMIDTLGNQKKVNYALRADMTKDEFVTKTIERVLPPSYFFQNAKMNKEGYDDIDVVIHRSNHGLIVHNFERVANDKDVIVLDVRHFNEFVKSHIPNSIWIGPKGMFASWVGAFIKNVNQPILLVAPPGEAAAAIVRLSRVGFDNVLGYLYQGFVSWKNNEKETESITSIPAKLFEDLLQKHGDRISIFDVRSKSDFEVTHLKNAMNTPLDHIDDYLEDFRKVKTIFLWCAKGYKSVIVASILKSCGIHNLVCIAGERSKIEPVTIPVVHIPNSVTEQKASLIH